MNIENRKESELLTELLINNRNLMLERICDNNEKEFLDACVEELKTTEQLLEKNEVKNFTVDEARLIQLCLEFANNDDELLDRFSDFAKDNLCAERDDELPNDNILDSIRDKLNIILKPRGQS